MGIKFEITNTKIYNLPTALHCAGFSRSANYNSDDESFKNLSNEINLNNVSFLNLSDSNIKKFIRLGGCKSGSGHDCFMKGITVSCVITAPQYWWKQAQRYHFFEIISSQSTMYNISEMQNSLDNNVLPQAVEALKIALEKYNKGEFTMSALAANIPSGLYLTAGITTNYLQIKSMYYQRKGHKLNEWNIFCEWAKTLPLMNYILK